MADEDFGAFTVLVFDKLQFSEDWIRSPGGFGFSDYTVYTSNGKKQKLLVVTQSNAGSYLSYLFLLEKNKSVWVNKAENIVHIPALPTKIKPGDALSK